MIWKENNNCLETEYTFASFIDAIAFIQAMTPKIEAINHHPTWENTYNKIKVKLQSHDAGNVVTKKDWELAKLMDEEFVKLVS